MSKINIKYNGEYPNLCRGTLQVFVDGKEWDFGEYCLSSGGSVYFDDDWSEHIESGPWTIDEWPDGFPEEYKEGVLNKVNSEIPYGCCGGCV